MKRVGFDHTQLLAAREASGLSLRELAERAGLSHQTLVILEAGKTQPRVDTLAKIARALGVELTSLLHGHKAVVS